MLIAALALAISAPSSFEDYMSGWWVIGADSEYVTFALSSSVNGPPEATIVSARLIGRTAVEGVSQAKFSIEINCLQRSSRYISIELLGPGGASLGPIEPPTPNDRPIEPASTGDLLATFVCEPEAKGIPSFGYPTKLPLEVVADHTFRIIGMGIEPSVAAPLAAIDARGAPDAFNDMLNLLVSEERQPDVRAIKTPEAFPE